MIANVTNLIFLDICRKLQPQYFVTLISLKLFNRLGKCKVSLTHRAETVMLKKSTWDVITEVNKCLKQIKKVLEKTVICIYVTVKELKPAQTPKCSFKPTRQEWFCITSRASNCCFYQCRLTEGSNTSINNKRLRARTQTGHQHAGPCRLCRQTKAAHFNQVNHDCITVHWHCMHCRWLPQYFQAPKTLLGSHSDIWTQGVRNDPEWLEASQ